MHFAPRFARKAPQRKERKRIRLALHRGFLGGLRYVSFVKPRKKPREPSDQCGRDNKSDKGASVSTVYVKQSRDLVEATLAFSGAVSLARLRDERLEHLRQGFFIFLLHPPPFFCGLIAERYVPLSYKEVLVAGSPAYPAIKLLIVSSNARPYCVGIITLHYPVSPCS